MVEAAYETPNPIYTVASDAPSYYNAATGQTGATLKASLKTIINTGVIKRSYGDSRYADSMLDQDPNNPQNVLEIYNRGSVPGTWDSTSANWTREHQWPTSLLPSGAPSSNTTKSQATDLFELRPINQSINSSRGNSTYGLPNSTGGTYNSTPQPFGLDPTQVYWYPGAADTGDVARTLFYMATMYGDSTSPNNLTLVNGDTNTVGQMGDLASLLKWNYTDPVDNFMDYSEDRCTDNFTPLQNARMRASIVTYRPGLRATAFSIGPGISGNWFDPNESGHGFSIEVLPGNRMLAQWYVYAPEGGPVWIVASGAIDGATATLQGYRKVGAGGRFPPNFESGQVQDQLWGTITFTFSDCNSGRVDWQSVVAGYASGSIPIVRLTMPAGLACP